VTCAFFLKTMIYPHSNQYTNYYTELPQRCRFRCVSIYVLFFSAVLPYYVWKRRCILVPINTWIATLSYVIGVPQSVNISWKPGKRVLFRVWEYFFTPVLSYENIMKI